jgi:hypothetical protein
VSGALDNLVVERLFLLLDALQNRRCSAFPHFCKRPRADDPVSRGTYRTLEKLRTLPDPCIDREVEDHIVHARWQVVTPAAVPVA